jgi:hypothetical protein
VRIKSGSVGEQDRRLTLRSFQPKGNDGHMAISTGGTLSFETPKCVRSHIGL